LFPASRADIIGRIFPARQTPADGAVYPCLAPPLQRPKFLFYELKEILNLAGRMIFADHHIKSIIINATKISHQEINYLYHRVFVISKNRMG